MKNSARGADPPVVETIQAKRTIRAQFTQALADHAALLAEHHDPELVKAELSRLNGTDALATGIRRERTQRTARATLDREDAEADLRLPPQRESYTLASYRSEPRVPKVERVENLQRAGHRTLLVASYKTGKSTLHANLTRSLTEGSQFLGRFAVKRPEGRVGVWNAEMESDDYEDYLMAAGVSQDDRVAIWNLRGYRVPLTCDAGAEAAVEWLRSNDVAYWIIDPWARMCSWSGADENANAEVGPLLQRVDEIAGDAGVEDILVVHHAGHARGRPRGATVLPDWADGIWLYWRDEESDDRYLKAEGRKVGLATGQVEIGEDGRATYREADPRKGKIHRLIKDVAAYVAANDGCTTSEVQDSLSGSNSLKINAVSRAVEMGMVRREEDPEDKRRKLLFFVASDPLDGTEF